VLEIIEKCKQEYFTDYRPMYEKLVAEKEKLQNEKAADQLGELTIKERDVVEE
jgi:hypothetical protein